LNGGSLDSIISLFDHEVCRHEHHPGACVELVNTWWPVIAKIIYNDAAARKVCTALSQGECEAQKYVVLLLKFEIFEMRISVIIPNALNMFIIELKPSLTS
jgi:hypothetical protein